MKKVFLMSFLISLYATSFAQFEEIVQEVYDLNKLFILKEKLALKVDYLYFEKHTSIDPYYAEVGRFNKNGSDYSTELFGIININQEGMSLVVDKNEKTMILTSSRFNYNVEMLNMEIIESSFKYCKDIRKTETSNQLIYSFIMDKEMDNEVEKIDMIFDSKTKIPKSIVLYYSKKSKLFPEDEIEDKPRLEIRYTEINAPFPYSWNSYLNKKGKSFEPKPSYANYTFHNLIQ